MCKGSILPDNGLNCTRESLHPPLSPPFSSSLPCLFPFLPSPSPSSLTECQGTVHAECVDKLDKMCSEVSEECMVRKRNGAINLGVVRECR